MADTEHNKRERKKVRLIQIHWDSVHKSPYGVFIGTATEAEKKAKEIRKILGNKPNSYPRVRVYPFATYPVEQLEAWARNYSPDDWE